MISTHEPRPNGQIGSLFAIQAKTTTSRCHLRRRRSRRRRYMPQRRALGNNNVVHYVVDCVQLPSGYRVEMEERNISLLCSVHVSDQDKQSCLPEWANKSSSEQCKLIAQIQFVSLVAANERSASLWLCSNHWLSIFAPKSHAKQLAKSEHADAILQQVLHL